MAPPSALWATAPVPTGGLPAQCVPTIAQTAAVGHSMSYTSSTGGTPVTPVQVCPPSTLRSSSPWSGTMAVTVVDTVPPARHVDALGHAALSRMPVPPGTAVNAQVCPASGLSAIAPCPWPLVVGT